MFVVPFWLFGLICCNALPRTSTQAIPIIKLEQEVKADGSYQWSYETANQISAEGKGYLKNVGVKDKEVQVAQGQFKYKDLDGNSFQLSYTADENGYQPQADHLPTPPPIPPAIQRALDYLKSINPK